MPTHKKDKHSEADKPELFVGLPDDKKLVIQLHKPMWEQLRRISFELNISMAELCRNGIDLILEHNKELLSGRRN